jgi:putative acetyltransferase
MHIRQAQLEDRDRVRRLYLSAFSDGEREAVAGLAVNLLAETTTPATFALVAETDGNLVGHVGFSPVACAKTDHIVGYILAPLSVHPDLQKQGIGTGLIESGIEQLSSLGAAIVFVYGDPRYYGRFGFDTRVAAQYVPPYQLQYDFGWQAKPLTRNASCPSSVMLTCVPSLMDPQLW